MISQSKTIYPSKEDYETWLDAQPLAPSFDLPARRNEASAMHDRLATALDAEANAERVTVEYYLPGVHRFTIRTRRDAESIRRGIETDPALRVLETKAFARDGKTYILGLVWCIETL